MALLGWSKKHQWRIVSDLKIQTEQLRSLGDLVSLALLILSKLPKRNSAWRTDLPHQTVDPRCTGADPGFQSGGPSGVLTPGIACAQNLPKKGFSLENAPKLHVFGFLGGKEGPGPQGLLDPLVLYSWKGKNTIHCDHLEWYMHKTLTCSWHLYTPKYLHLTFCLSPHSGPPYSLDTPDGSLCESVCDGSVSCDNFWTLGPMHALLAPHNNKSSLGAVPGAVSFITQELFLHPYILITETTFLTNLYIFTCLSWDWGTTCTNPGHPSSGATTKSLHHGAQGFFWRSLWKFTMCSQKKRLNQKQNDLIWSHKTIPIQSYVVQFQGNLFAQLRTRLLSDNLGLIWNERLRQVMSFPSTHPSELLHQCWFSFCVGGACSLTKFIFFCYRSTGKLLSGLLISGRPFATVFFFCEPITRRTPEAPYLTANGYNSRKSCKNKKSGWHQWI